MLEAGFAEERGDGPVFRPGSLEALRQKELARVGHELAHKYGRTYRGVKTGDHVEGVYRAPVHLASGRYALIERSREFTLVPWRDVLEKHRGKALSGVVHGLDVAWNLGRKRGLGR